jgi:hypothetical protein
MKTLLETIKEHDAKMQSSAQEVELLSQALRLLMDDLIDSNLILCLEPEYVKHAYEVLKARGEIDSWRKHDYEVTQSGKCEFSNKVKEAVTKLSDSFNPLS